MARLIFLGVIATFLLGLYTYSIYHSIDVLKAINAPDCPNHDCLKLNEGIKLILSLVGGLISALVISVLAITPPNTSPSNALINSVQPTNVVAAIDVSELTRTVTAIITYLYLLVWLGTGIVAVIYGFVLDYDHPVAELTAAAKSWLGLAVAAAYAFFGLKMS